LSIDDLPTFGQPTMAMKAVLV
jgi:hypothetical protein